MCLFAENSDFEEIWVGDMSDAVMELGAAGTNLAGFAVV